MTLQKLLSYTRRAVDDYELIEAGDKIAVGISGGKDSLTLLYALKHLQKFYPKSFELLAVTVDLGYDSFDLSPVRTLCEELEVTVAELMDGEISEENSVRTYDDEQILDLLRRTQELEKQKNMLYGIMLIVMGIAVQALSYAIGGSDFKDFISGLLLGLSIGEMLVGVYVVGKSLAGR